jgi:hypothetical protein
MSEIQPISRVTVDAFMKVYREMCPTVDHEVPIEDFAAQLRWSIERTRTVAEWLDERELIDTDGGMGSAITTIEGRY